MELSKVVSHALRHEPWLYELELDDEGWVEIDTLLKALSKEREEWSNLNHQDLQEMIEQSSKQRHEIMGDKIRALYGHSENNSLKKSPCAPPEILYHGTNSEFIDNIMQNGLLPMTRQFVHLSLDTNTAIAVGKRKDKQPALLIIKSGDAYKSGIAFYKGNEHVWLADKIPAEYIKIALI